MQIQKTFANIQALLSMSLTKHNHVIKTLGTTTEFLGLMMKARRKVGHIFAAFQMLLKSATPATQFQVWQGKLNVTLKISLSISELPQTHSLLHSVSQCYSPMNVPI